MLYDIDSGTRILMITAAISISFAKQPTHEVATAKNTPQDTQNSLERDVLLSTDCSSGKNASSNCILRRWYSQMGAQRPTKNNNYNIGRSGVMKTNLANFVSPRPYNTTHSVYHDCLFYNRGVRPYPGTCYKPVTFDRQKKAIPKELKESWEAFYKEIAGDLMYTFDFVLWSEKEDIHNSFWYLILYLKELAIAVDNPMDIVSKKYHDSQMERLDNKLATADSALTQHNQTLDTLEKSLTDLSKTMTSYQNVMSTLQNKLNKIISSMPYDKVDQNTLLGKLNYLSVQSILVGGLFNNTMLNKNIKRKNL